MKKFKDFRLNEGIDGIIDIPVEYTELRGEVGEDEMNGELFIDIWNDYVDTEMFMGDDGNFKDINNKVYSIPDMLKILNQKILRMGIESITVDEMIEELQKLKDSGYGEELILFTEGGGGNFTIVDYISSSPETSYNYDNTKGIVIGKETW